MKRGQKYRFIFVYKDGERMRKSSAIFVEKQVQISLGGENKAIKRFIADRSRGMTVITV